MTKKERKHIKEKAESFLKRCEEENALAKETDDFNKKFMHQITADKYWALYDAYNRLLSEVLAL